MLTHHHNNRTWRWHGRNMSLRPILPTQKDPGQFHTRTTTTRTLVNNKTCITFELGIQITLTWVLNEHRKLEENWLFWWSQAEIKWGVWLTMRIEYSKLPCSFLPSVIDTVSTDGVCLPISSCRHVLSWMVGSGQGCMLCLPEAQSSHSGDLCISLSWSTVNNLKLNPLRNNFISFYFQDLG